MKNLVAEGKSRFILAALAIIMFDVNCLPMLSVNVLGNGLMTTSGYGLSFGKIVTILGQEVSVLSQNWLFIISLLIVPIIIIVLNLVHVEVIDEESVYVFSMVCAAIGLVTFGLGVNNLVSHADELLTSVSITCGPATVALVDTLILLCCVLFIKMNDEALSKKTE